VIEQILSAPKRLFEWPARRGRKWKRQIVPDLIGSNPAGLTR
jgi:hypothetical protein